MIRGGGMLVDVTTTQIRTTHPIPQPPTSSRPAKRISMDTSCVPPPSPAGGYGAASRSGGAKFRAPSTRTCVFMCWWFGCACVGVGVWCARSLAYICSRRVRQRPATVSGGRARLGLCAAAAAGRSTQAARPTAELHGYPPTHQTTDRQHANVSPAPPHTTTRSMGRASQHIHTDLDCRRHLSTYLHTASPSTAAATTTAARCSTNARRRLLLVCVDRIWIVQSSHISLRLLQDYRRLRFSEEGFPPTSGPRFEEAKAK